MRRSLLATIDLHTAGIGMRLLTSGLGRLPGSTIAEKRRWFHEHKDHLRPPFAQRAGIEA